MEFFDRGLWLVPFVVVGGIAYESVAGPWWLRLLLNGAIVLCALFEMARGNVLIGVLTIAFDLFVINPFRLPIY